MLSSVTDAYGTCLRDAQEDAPLSDSVVANENALSSKKRIYSDDSCTNMTGYTEQSMNNDTGCISEWRFDMQAVRDGPFYFRYQCHKQAVLDHIPKRQVPV